MPIFRGPSGEIKFSTEHQTRLDPRAVISTVVDELPTRNLLAEPSQVHLTAPQEEPKTRVFFQRRTLDQATSVEEALADPVVGWVVIINGPGKGQALPLGYGMNNIGRSKQERICLDFGDEDISRTQHAIITYDPRGRKFYVQHGGGRNLTYLGPQPLLIPAQLHGGEEIIVGRTTLRFVPLCGEDFDWQNHS